MGLRFRISGFGFKIIKGDPGIKASGSQGSHDMQVHFGPYMLGVPLRGRWRSGEEAHHKPERLNPSPLAQRNFISVPGAETMRSGRKPRAILNIQSTEYH